MLEPGECLWLESETHFGWEQVPGRCQDAVRLVCRLVALGAGAGAWEPLSSRAVAAPASPSLLLG